MKTISNREIQTVFILLALMALSMVMSGCGGGSNNAFNSNNSSNSTSQNQNMQAQQTPTPTTNPVDAFVGVWETSDLTSPNYLSVRISSGTKKGDDYVGKITDINNGNNDLADYTIKEKSREITLDYKPPYVSSQGTSSTYEYEISGDSSTITLKGNKPIVLKKGSSNTEILRDVEILSKPMFNPGGSRADWAIDPNISQKIFPNNPSLISVEFEAATKYNEGYRGKMKLSDGNGPVAEWTYTIPSKNKIEINDGRGTKSASYKIRDDAKQMVIDFVNDSDTDLYFLR